MQNCVGAIDGTHIDCKPPIESREAYHNRKGLLSQNILAACSFDMKFTYILAGWEGRHMTQECFNQHYQVQT